MNSRRVLIVEDSSMVRRLMRKELEAEGYQVHEAENGRIAMEMITEVAPDVITMDIEMPEMDGYETCHMIRESQEVLERNKKMISELPVVFLTANSNMEFRRKAFQAGGNEYLTKPPVQGEVANAVNRMFAQSETLKGQKVLLVDDDVTARKLVISGLKQEGLEILEAENGEMAIELLERFGTEIDLVMTDLKMPIMNGIELCRYIRKDLALLDLPVIFLTFHGDADNIMEIFKNGGTDYLVKPFAKAELFARLNIHLHEKMLKEEMRAKVRKLKEADKMKNTFLSIASHDLRSPLNGILGFSDLLLAHDLDQEAKEYVSYIQSSGRFLLSLIEDLLDLSRLESQKAELNVEPVAVMEVLDSCKETLLHMASPKEITLSLSNGTSYERPLIMADQNALMQIANNLVSNAIKFTPNKGKVLVRVVEHQQGYLTVEVEDTGIGIPEEMLPHLFDRFTKASQAGTAGEKSTGLGMSITKQLVEQLDGNIEVISHEGKGTLFQVHLPISKGEQG